MSLTEAITRYQDLVTRDDDGVRIFRVGEILLREGGPILVSWGGKAVEAIVGDVKGVVLHCRRVGDSPSLPPFWDLSIHDAGIRWTPGSDSLSAEALAMLVADALSY